MKNCIKLFLLFCLLLAVYSLSAAEKSAQTHQPTFNEMFVVDAVPFIDLLQIGENYRIEIVSISCFNGSKQTLVVSREPSAYLVTFGDVVKELDALEINAIRDFELELQSLSIGGCSTVDHYRLLYGGTELEVSDGTCSFNGGRKLIKQLGL